VTAIVTFDEGPGVGLGHRRRCEVIAATLRARGWETVALALDPSSTRLVVDAPVVVVDSYAFRADDRSHFRGGVVIALDDLRRDLDVAVVVDPAPGATRAPHRRAGQVLAGAPYALVDPHLRSLGCRATESQPKTVLVATGAADKAGVGAEIAQRIRAEFELVERDVAVRLAVGPWGSRRVPEGVDIVERDDGLAVELAAADVVVTAGGVTLLESLCLGRPTVAVALAPNQRANVEGVVAEGAALLVDPGDVASAVRRLVDDTSLRVSIAAAARRLIDGHGVDRVVEAIVAATLRAAA
jgi:UDP-2,4-diacetamido-2,4,6-trideoxy-beta-L-altropyranose hydrolase